jgi:hypothetical protein
MKERKLGKEYKVVENRIPKATEMVSLFEFFHAFVFSADKVDVARKI